MPNYDQASGTRNGYREQPSHLPRAGPNANAPTGLFHAGGIGSNPRRTVSVAGACSVRGSTPFVLRIGLPTQVQARLARGRRQKLADAEQGRYPPEIREIEMGAGDFQDT